MRGGKWDLGSGIWETGSEKWDLGSGIWEVGCKRWEMGSEIWEVGSFGDEHVDLSAALNC
ncbi:MAG: hypothetical protein ACOCG5_00420 [Candidatus Alkaliphilus sp. MAG34]|nr:hypothetical protein [Clostridiales bacterium]